MASPGPAPGNGKPRIAVLCGSDEDAEIQWRQDAQVPVAGNNDVHRLIDGERFSWGRVHLAPGYFDQERRWRLDGCRLAFNIVSEPDSNPRTLRIVDRIVAPLDCPVINAPGAIRLTTRESTAQRLRGVAGAIVPRVLRVRHPTVDQFRLLVDAGLISFPSIVRPAGTHTGRVVGLFERPEDWEGAVADAGREYIVIEFFDARRRDGLYPKIRFFFIGDTVLVRHLFLGDQWNVHGTDYGRVVMADPRLEAEEEDLLRRGFDGLPALTREALRGIRRRVDLDYFGLDAAIMPDDRLLVFECNATMNFFPLSHKGHGLYKHEVCLPPARAAMTRLLLHRLSR